MNPVILAALISQVAIPELTRWLAQLHADDRVVTEADALALLNTDIDGANALGQQFLDSHPPTA